MKVKQFKASILYIFTVIKPPVRFSANTRGREGREALMPQISISRTQARFQKPPHFNGVPTSLRSWDAEAPSRSQVPKQSQISWDSLKLRLPEDIFDRVIIAEAKVYVLY